VHCEESRLLNQSAGQKGATQLQFAFRVDATNIKNCDYNHSTSKAEAAAAMAAAAGATPRAEDMLGPAGVLPAGVLAIGGGLTVVDGGGRGGGLAVTPGGGDGGSGGDGGGDDAGVVVMAANDPVKDTVLTV